MRAERFWQLALERSQAAAASGSLVPLDTEVLPLGPFINARSTFDRQGDAGDPATRAADAVSGASTGASATPSQHNGDQGGAGPGAGFSNPGDWHPFVVRRLLSATPKHLNRAGPRPNPFLPWDRELAVAPLGSSHLLLLNKYPVQAGHVLVITQEWQPQKGWLRAADWAAVAEVDRDTGGLWFFNSSPAAGASQPHRHLQLLPRLAGSPSCPMAPLLLAQLQGELGPWAWSYRLSRRSQSGDPEELGALYGDHARSLGLGDPQHDPQPLHPYNLLFDDQWFLTVQRHRDDWAGFSVNALGFAGYLLVTDRADLDWLRSRGPWALLETVASKVQ